MATACKHCGSPVRPDEHGIWRDTFGTRLCAPKNRDHVPAPDLTKTQPARMVRTDGSAAGGAAAKKSPKA